MLSKTVASSTRKWDVGEDGKLEIGVVPSIRIEGIWVDEVFWIVHVIVDASGDQASLLDEKIP